jgi:hypothetical protein
MILNHFSCRPANSPAGYDVTVPFDLAKFGSCISLRIYKRCMILHILHVCAVREEKPRLWVNSPRPGYYKSAWFFDPGVKVIENKMVRAPHRPWLQALLVPEFRSSCDYLADYELGRAGCRTDGTVALSFVVKNVTERASRRQSSRLGGMSIGSSRLKGLSQPGGVFGSKEQMPMAVAWDRGQIPSELLTSESPLFWRSIAMRTKNHQNHSVDWVAGERGVAAAVSGEAELWEAKLDEWNISKLRILKNFSCT